jgi:hypothetical protein
MGPMAHAHGMGPGNTEGPSGQHAFQLDCQWLYASVTRIQRTSHGRV